MTQFDEAPTGSSRLPYRVLIADDHELLRDGLRALMNSTADLEVVGEAANGADAIRLCQELQPDVVLMDLKMPEMDGLTAIQMIHAAQPDIRLIALSGFGEEHLIRAALRNGALSYLLKTISGQKLIDAIRIAIAGLPTLAPEAAQALVEAPPHPTHSNLTSREKDVLELMVNGMSNAQISEVLCISVFTVKNHVSNILSKFGVNNRTEAVSLALKNHHSS